MFRLLIGSILGGLAQFFVGFLFWGTPLSKMVFTVVPDMQNADVQAALARNFSASGTGTYYVPWPDTAAGTVMHGKGPVALIFFNTNGFPLMEPSSLLVGLILSIVTVLLIGLALHAISGRVFDFATRARIVVLVSIAAALYFIFAQPVFNYYLPWGYWVYLGISDLIGLIVGGLILARWFLPNGPAIARGGAS